MTEFGCDYTNLSTNCELTSLQKLVETRGNTFDIVIHVLFTNESRSRSNKV